MADQLHIDTHDPHHLDRLSEAQLDALPCGAIRVDATGTILFYSRFEAQITGREPTAVLGRNFFADVAPCTVVPEFYGRFRTGVLTGHLHTTFEFVFDFDMHPVQVRITMRASERAGEYWIIVESPRKLLPRDTSATYNLIAQKFSDGAVDLSSVSFDFSQCDSLPVACCGAVQPFGCLLVLDPETLRITACSANTGRFLSQEPLTLLGAPIAAALPGAGEALDRCLGSDPLPFACPPLLRIQITTQELPLHLRPHRWRGQLLLEIEPAGAMAAQERCEVFDQTTFNCRLAGCDDVAAVCREATTAMRHLCGCERVVAYRFEPDGDGIVIAEDSGGRWPSILGLRYPATDIPRQARALYRETPLRYAPSREHSDCLLLSLDPQAAPIDIGIAHLRAQAPIHRDYLKRFGVDGSMSLSILVDGDLWGLFIFHHPVPHPVAAPVRQRLIELADYPTARIALLDERARRQANERGMARVNQVIGDIDLELPFPANFGNREALLRDLLKADAVQVYHEGEPLFPGQTFGLTPAQIQPLLAFIGSRGGTLWHTECLSGEFEPAAAYPDRVAGVLAIFVGADRQDLLLFTRARTEYTLRWGSDPASLPFPDTPGDRPLGWPNRLFQVWQERRTHHAPAWSATEIAIGHALSDLIRQVIVANAAHFERLARDLAQQTDRLQRSRVQLEHLARHDALTGLPNRRSFREALVTVIADSHHDEPPFGMALLDIDHFKTINDTLGHDKGDVLLSAVAGRLSDALSPGDFVARLGGDEFALLLCNAQEADLAQRAERVLRALRELITVGEDNFAITASMGITLGGGDADPSALMKQADLALYRAKEDGRNCIRSFNRGLEEVAQRQLEIARALLIQPAAEAIEILLQPQVPICAPSGGQRRFEVLARWRRPDGTLILPGDFVPAAERNGLMREITRVVSGLAIGVLRANPQAGAGLRLCVNVSAADLEARWFARGLIEDLQAAEVPSDCLELEITEALLLRLTPTVRESLRVLAAGGVTFALDDFGTGFSSMVHLRELPIDVVKIDRRFVSGITDADPRDRNLVAGMIALTHSLGKIVVAEGVETAAQVAELTRLKCDWGQGYLWSRPVAPDAALALRL